MKLLQINVSVNWGSIGKITEDIGLIAMTEGWDSYIAYGRMMNPSKSNLIKVGSVADVYLHYARNRFIDGEGLGSKNATIKLINNIENLRPDIIHLHDIHDHWINYPILFKYLHSIDIPVVWTFHDCWAFTGGCAYFEIPYCDKWESDFGCKECHWRKWKISNRCSQFRLRKELIASLGSRLTIIPVSNWLEKYTHRSILKSSNIKMIHNGIDINRFNIIRRKNIKPLILGVANVWDSRKGLNDIIKIRTLIPEEKADITLVGLTKKQKKNLPSGITGITRTQNINELVELYNRATVFINPTYADNFPTVNLEALACGTPVITYRTGGSPEAIDESTGIVVEKGDYEGMKNAIFQVINNPQDFNALDCRKRAEIHFNRDIQFYKYIELYNNLIHYGIPTL